MSRTGHHNCNCKESIGQEATAAIWRRRSRRWSGFRRSARNWPSTVELAAHGIGRNGDLSPSVPSSLSTAVNNTTCDVKNKPPTPNTATTDIWRLRSGFWSGVRHSARNWVRTVSAGTAESTI
eukprot:398633-Rhodomonas_salina.1